MKIRILGGGWYGCHLTVALAASGHDTELHEISDTLFAGASGANPARLHLGFHYPRSKLTRAMSQEHYAVFMQRYASLTRGVPINIYAIASNDSLVDFDNYVHTLRGEVEFVRVESPSEFGLKNVEGALLTGERHINIGAARAFFTKALAGRVKYGATKGEVDAESWDYTIDCTFCAMDSENIDRYEPCVTALVKGPTNTAVTIMDGPFPSIYPWDEDQGLSSLTSAKWTPLKRCSTRSEAEEILNSVSKSEVEWRANQMMLQMAQFYPSVHELYSVCDVKLSIRAMPRSGADSRLVDVVRVGKRALRVRAGKIDAIEHAARVVNSMLEAT